jgi:hypothetical protein
MRNKKLLSIYIVLFLLCFFNSVGNTTEGLSDPVKAGASQGSGPSSPTTVKTAFISATTNGDNTVVTGVEGKRILVWSFEVSASIASDVYWKSGTTTNSEVVYLSTKGGWVRDGWRVHNFPSPVIITDQGEDLILNSSTTGPLGVFVKYTEE